MVDSTGRASGEQSEAGVNEVYADSTVAQGFTIEDALALTAPTDRILCTLADNTYIRFGEYSVADYDSRTTILHVTKETNEMQDAFARQMEQSGELTMEMRVLKHNFSQAFF